jgi:NCS1 family nucleobase:cation symporter-1
MSPIALRFSSSKKAELEPLDKSQILSSPGSNTLSNFDIAPTTAVQRTWRWWNFAALWLGMVINVPAYMLGGQLIAIGMSPGQSVVTILLGNLIVLCPILLVSHIGGRYGVPFAVAVRSSFGIRGAAFPALARAAVSFGWFGIQTWIGGKVLLALAVLLVGHPLEGPPLRGLGINIFQLISFVLFWLLQIAFIGNSLGPIRRLETWTAPIKLVVCVVMVVWALRSTPDGISGLWSLAGPTSTGASNDVQFWSIFWPSLTAMIASWSPMALSISDFTRFARTQTDQVVGQALGLPGPMGGLAAVSVITTAATVVLFGRAIWDPVELAGHFSGPLIAFGLAMILLDTMSVNVAANLVAPAFDLASVWPKRFTYRRGAHVAALIGAAILPWKLLEDPHGYIFVWLTGYSAFLGPICGVMIGDYWLIRRAKLSIHALYEPDGIYSYFKGWSVKAVVAVALGIAPNIPGLLHAVAPESFVAFSGLWSSVYSFAWILGLLVAMTTYVLLSRTCHICSVAVSMLGPRF